MRWAILACVCGSLTGCRQILGIGDGVVVGETPDATVDMMPDDVIVPIGHDEDSDGHADTVDNCPATMNADQDAGAELLGSACDPRPSDAGDQIAVFVPFFPQGQPPELENTLADYQTDYVVLSNREIRTHDQFPAIRVTADFTNLTFEGGNSFLELSVGSRTCRISDCAPTTCVVAGDGVGNQSEPLSMAITGPGTLVLDETPTAHRCTLIQDGLVAFAFLNETTSPNDRARVRANKVSVDVKNLVVYVASPL